MLAWQSSTALQHTHTLAHTQRRGYTCSDCFVQHFSNNFSVAASFALHTLRRDFFTCACMRAESLFSSASSPSPFPTLALLLLPGIEKFTMQLSMQILPTCHVDKYNALVPVLSLSLSDSSLLHSHITHALLFYARTCPSVCVFQYIYYC